MRKIKWLVIVGILLAGLTFAEDIAVDETGVIATPDATYVGRANYVFVKNIGTSPLYFYVNRDTINLTAMYKLEPNEIFNSSQPINSNYEIKFVIFATDVGVTSDARVVFESK